MEASNPYAPPVAPVRDVLPEGTGNLAGRGARLGASLLDGLISSLLIALPMFFFIDMDQLVTGTSVNYGALVGAAGLAALPGLVIYAVVTLWLVKRNGQTIGKKLLEIKVVRSSGERAGVGRIFWLRNVITTAIAMVPIVGGLFSILDSLLIFRQSRKCLHDQIADTIVIQA